MDHLLNKAEVYNTYGPSETTVCASYYRCNSGTVLEDGTYPIGHPVLGAQIRILDQSGNEVAKGQTGEICIYGGGVSLGYIGDHAEENSAFERQPDGSTMYRSGDLGYILPNGNIAFLHRKDDQIMITASGWNLPRWSPGSIGARMCSRLLSGLLQTRMDCPI